MTGAVDALYAGLARWHWYARKLRRAAPGQALELHKKLVPPAAGACGPPAGQQLHDWLWQHAELDGAANVLDVGCGFGATVLHWARTRPGQFVGLGTCAFQIERARAEATRLGLAPRCRFVQQSYDDPIAGRFDAVVAIETLLHARDLTRALRNLAACVAPTGRIVALEDVGDGAAADAVATADLCHAWRSQRLWTTADYAAAARGAGLATVATDDLTAQVPIRDEVRLQRAERSLRALRYVLPGRYARGAVDAFLGGIALERLYQKRATRYLCMVLAPEAR